MDPHFINLEEEQILDAEYSLWLLHSFVSDIKPKKKLDK